MTFSENYKLLITGLLTLVLSACGGGEGGPSTGNTISVGGGAATATVSGTFVDAAVNGITFTGSPSSTTGLTGANGTAGGFTVDEGDTVTFSIGGLSLGSSSGAVTSGKIITPAELAGNAFDASNPRAIRIARFLQSLDDDGNTSNGITISTNTVNAIAALSQGDRDNLAAALLSGTNFDTIVGGLIDNLTAGNTVPRAEGDLVSAVDAESELLVAVNAATGGVTGTSSTITAHPTGNCPVGDLALARSPEFFGQTFPVCVLSDRITSDVTMTNDHLYVLQDVINVGDGERTGGPTGTDNAVLTIQPGTQIFGHEGIKAALVITRGSRIQAIGTPDLPIIMAAVTATGAGVNTVVTSDPSDLTGRGQWGGLVLSGRGINNKCTGGEVSAEAVETVGERKFGCDDNTDNSGTVEYVIIAESGLVFRTDQEVQGLTIEAAGSNTRINNLQVLGSEDDGIEWFGGAASASNVVINGADDDALDWDEGFVGTIQNALIIFGTSEGDKGIEADSRGVSYDGLPESNPNVLNLTMIGNTGKGGTIGLHYKEGTQGQMWRSAIIDGANAFVNGCIYIQHELDTVVSFRDVIMDCANGTTAPAPVDFFGLFEDGDMFTSSFFTTVAADKRDIIPLTGILDSNTLAITGQGIAPNNPVAPPAGVNGNTVGNYFGAVDPAAAAPDNNPTNGGPFWDGWTYRNTAVQGNLPGANFHPLAEEIADGAP